VRPVTATVQPQDDNGRGVIDCATFTEPALAADV